MLSIEGKTFIRWKHHWCCGQINDNWTNPTGRSGKAVALLSRKDAHNTTFANGARRNSCLITVALLLLPKWEKQSSFVFFFCAVKLVSYFGSTVITSMSISTVCLMLIQFSGKKKIHRKKCEGRPPVFKNGESGHPRPPPVGDAPGECCDSDSVTFTCLFISTYVDSFAS